MRILNLDLDFFVSPIAYNREDSFERLPDDEYSIWDAKTLRCFLENQCKLDKKNPTRGRIVTFHKEVFFLWKELIEARVLDNPFQLWHIDAHDDLGGDIGDDGLKEICTEILTLPYYKRAVSTFSKLTSGNYLTYAFACRWISKFTFVKHPEDIEPFIDIFSTDKKCIELKGWTSKDWSTLPPDIVDPKVPFSMSEKNIFLFPYAFDWVFVSRSPSFTPQKADKLLEIIEAYIETRK